MTDKDRFIKIISIVVTVMGLLAVAYECRAGYYQPETVLTLLSAYSGFNESAATQTRVWKVVPGFTSDGRFKVRFFTADPSETESMCTLEIPPSGTAGEIRWNGTGTSAEKTSGTGLLLVPGFPVPADVLPVGINEAGRTYREKREAGGTVFVKSYKVFSEVIKTSDAMTSGWLKNDFSGGGTALILVTVIDDRGKLVVRQLWPSDGSWWLYEETPLRHSWLMSN